MKEKVTELKEAIAIKKKETEDETQISDTEYTAKNSIPTALECPNCGERTLIVEGKCTSCKRCGYSKCD